MIVLELLQLKHHGVKNYMTSVWNLIDAAVLICTVAVNFLIITEGDSYYIRTLSAYLSIMLGAKTFYYMRIFDKTAALIKMIIAVSYNSIYFAMILFIAILAFTNAFYLIAQ